MRNHLKTIKHDWKLFDKLLKHIKNVLNRFRIYLERLKTPKILKRNSGDNDKTLNDVSFVIQKENLNVYNHLLLKINMVYPQRQEKHKVKIIA